ncbi:MAG: NifU family protein [Alphaproteobacteria bacterium]|jgi:Fe-S cluster biogenesis protein NfuA
MFIQTEPTPNPLTLKFIPGVQVMPSGTLFFTSRESAKGSPLAYAIFTSTEVSAVFLSDDFISVTKSEHADWELLKPQLLTVIMDHFTTGKPVLAEAKGDSAMVEDNSEIAVQIRELIDTRVRPAVAQDGGDIVFRSFEDGIVKLELRGACSGCPSSTATLKQGIENMLKHYVPEVIAVEAVA